MIPPPDFSKIRLPSGPHSARGLPPCKAVGRTEGVVVDATAGLGGDAFLLAVSGLEVLAFERHPEVFAALAEGLARAEADPKLSRWLGGRLRLVHGDARLILPSLGDVAAVHVDPMFPPKRKKAAPKKGIQLLRQLVGDDHDAGELLSVAREVAARVAVKRPRHAPPLAEGPDAVIRSKLGRYDVYLREARGAQTLGPE
jgi:16S rRNA (guanine1516-N2)-methyltransferase